MAVGVDIDRELAKAFSDAFLRRCLRAVFTARRLAWEDCQKRYAYTEAENARPFIARANLEGLLRDVAERSGLASVVSKASNWNHTEVKSNGLVLTQNSVANPCALLDVSDYRLVLARDNDQGVLFEDDVVPPQDPSFLVLLLHSQYRCADTEEQRKYGYLAGSAYLAVPASDLKGYLRRVNLFDRFPDVVADHFPAEWDQEVQVRYLSRARRAAQ